MNIVLIRPSNPSGSTYLTKWGFLPVPLGLLQLAGSLLTLEDARVKIIDMEADPQKTVESVIEETLRYDPDIVGITIHATAAHMTSIEIAGKLKEVKKDTLLVAGGHQATFVPQDLLRNGFDIVVLGEGDETIKEVANAFRSGSGFENIPGIVFNKEEGRCVIVQTDRRPLIPDLDSLPFPALHLVNSHAYSFKAFGGEKVVALETARGCPYACDFCSVTPTWGNKWRSKSNRRILMELELARKLGYKWLFFVDDIFVVYPNVNQRMSLFDSMIDEGYDQFKWMVQMRADVTAKNPKLIERGAEAGMRIAFLGVESGSQEILKKLHKGIFTSQSVQAVRTLDENGVIVLLGMMLGAPYETLNDMLTTIKFSLKLADVGADAVQFTLYTPLPGTRIFNDSLRKRKLLTLDWSRYDVLTPVMDSKINPAVVQLLQFYGNYSFYLLKWLKSRIGAKSKIVVKGFKKDLVMNAQKFIYEMMPYYLRDLLLFPKQLIKTFRLFASDKEMGGVTKEEVDELIKFSDRIIYLETEGKNPYFRIKEAG